MAANGGISPKQQAAAIALARGASHSEVVESVGVGDRTLSRWKTQPEFQDAVLASKRELYDQAIALVIDANCSAARALKEIVEDSSKPAGARVSAARALLDSGYRGFESAELARRIEIIEEALSEAQCEGD